MRRSRCSPLKWLVLVLVAIVLTLCTFILVVMNVPSCKSWLVNQLVGTDVGVDVENITLRDIGLTTVLVDVTVSVENTNSVGVTLDRIYYDIYFERDGEWIKLGEGERTEDVTIEAKGSTSFSITHQLKIIPSIRAFYQVYSEGSPINMKAVGSAWLKFWLFSFEIPFEQVRMMEL
jgi:LEA14-like dessication related protein